MLQLKRDFGALLGHAALFEGIGELRKEFLDLQKENRELRKDFNALEKKFNAVETKPDTTKKGSPILKSPRQKSAG